MTLWQALATVDGADNRDRVVWPKLHTYFRYQRNQMTRTLAAEGLTVEEIRTRLASIASEVPSVSHIRRIIDET